MIRYNLPITVIRPTAEGEERLELRAIDTADAYQLPVDADIRAGDSVEQQMPSGRVRTVYITRVDVLQSPFGSNRLDHTKAHYSATPPRPPHDSATAPRAGEGATTFHVQATNVQVATGPYAHQTMTVGATADHLVQLIEGIAQLTNMAGIADPADGDLARVRDAAIAHVQGARPDPNAVRRFADWVSERVKTGANAAVSAAIGAAVSGLIQNAEAFARAVGS